MRSVVEQSYFETIALVIADDCSTDGTWEKIHEVLKTLSAEQVEHISVSRNKSNLGWIGNHNHVMSLAKTPFFTILNGDDFLDLDYVEKLLKAIEDDLSLDVVLCGEKKVLESEIKNRISFPNTPIGKLRHIQMSEFLVKTEYIKQNNIWLPNLPTGADAVFNLKLIQTGKTRTINCYGYNNRYHPDSVSGVETQEPDNYLKGSLMLLREFAKNDQWRNKYSHYVITSFILTSYLGRVVNRISFKKFSGFLDQFLQVYKKSYQSDPTYFTLSGMRAQYQIAIFMLVFNILTHLKMRHLLFSWCKITAKIAKY
jgi:glycosyltransferase involved in cell wall biosynthesis